LDLADVAASIPEVKVKILENVARFLQLPSAGKIETIEEYDRWGLWVDGNGRKKLLENAKMLAHAALEFLDVAIYFPIQQSRLTGLPLDHVMAAAVGFRVDSYLVTQAHRIGELIPTRNEQPFFTYRGALVLEPTAGLHENVAVLDFSSMYPALMKEYNLSPDTLVHPGESASGDAVYIMPDVNHRFRKKPDGFYKTVLTTLINERSSLKKQLDELKQRTESTEYRVLKDRERALKVITNACYGYVGWAGARWYAREVAESAAALGRLTITKTIEHARAIGLNIIYSDTDSIFVSNERSKIAELIHWAEKKFEGIEIRVEQVYNRILFTEAMKRYAGLRPDKTIDIVGLEVIRGDWSEIAHQVQEQVLREILANNSTEKAIEAVKATIRRLRNGEVPIADLTIRKTLTKRLEKYAVRAPHVEVARKLISEGWRLSVGDKVSYVITKGPGNLFKKARPYSQVKPDDIDTEYYLENQIKPAAMRILEVFGVQEKQLLV
jgi:DNA polymerase I